MHNRKHIGMQMLEVSGFIGLFNTKDYGAKYFPLFTKAFSLWSLFNCSVGPFSCVDTNAMWIGFLLTLTKSWDQDRQNSQLI